MSLTKRDIARAIHEAEPEISISEAVSFVDAIFTAVKDRLAAGGKVMITNFGTFQVVERAARQGINPATGGGLIIEGHRAVAFRPSPFLQELLNRRGSRS
jgi:DNA-binding protein HU-beta